MGQIITLYQCRLSRHQGDVIILQTFINHMNSPVIPARVLTLTAYVHQRDKLHHARLLFALPKGYNITFAKTSQ